MPLYMVKNDPAKEAGEKPLRHLDEACEVLVETSTRGEGIVKVNNTETVQKASERCPKCFTEEALKESRKKKRAVKK